MKKTAFNPEPYEQYHLHKRQPEKLQFEVYDLRDYRHKNKNDAAVAHSHSYYQIIWFFKAGGSHTIDFRSYTIDEDSLFFISKDQVHCFDSSLEIEGRLIHFNDSFFTHSDVDAFLKSNILKKGENPRYTLDKATKKIAHSYLQLIEWEMKKRLEFGFEALIRFLLKAFLIQIERLHNLEGDKLNLTDPYELQYFKFSNLVEDHFSKRHEVKYYADLLHISTKTLAAICRQHAGKSPSQIIAERVILEAKRLLQFTPLRINEIAYKVGFEDPSYFTKYFKRYLEVSAIQFRKNTSNK